MRVCVCVCEIWRLRASLFPQEKQQRQNSAEIRLIWANTTRLPVPPARKQVKTDVVAPPPPSPPFPYSCAGGGGHLIPCKQRNVICSLTIDAPDKQPEMSPATSGAADPLPPHPSPFWLSILQTAEEKTEREISKSDAYKVDSKKTAILRIFSHSAVEDYSLRNSASGWKVVLLQSFYSLFLISVYLFIHLLKFYIHMFS